MRDKARYKILMVAPTSFFSDYGAHVRPLEEICALQAMGHKVVVCTYGSGNDVPGVDIRRATMTGRSQVSIGSSKRKMVYDIMLFLRTLRMAWAFRPDIIHAHLHEGALIAQCVRLLYPLHRAPVIFDYQGSLTAEMVDHRFMRKTSVFYRPFRWLETVIDRLSGAIIASSHNAAAKLRQDYHVRVERIFTIGDGVDTTRFRPPATDDEQQAIAELRASLGIPADRKVIAYLGKLAPYQGTDLLLEAAKLMLPAHPDYHFLIMGYPGADDYRRLAEYMGIGDHVTFSGRVPYLEAHRYLALGDIAVAPKLSETEGAGKIANYMAMALPTVTFDTPVGREFLGDLGYYAPATTAEALAATLEQAMADPNRVERGLALRRKAMVERSWQRAAKDIVSVYRMARARQFTLLDRWRTQTHPLPTIKGEPGD